MLGSVTHSALDIRRAVATSINQAAAHLHDAEDWIKRAPLEGYMYPAHSLDWQQGYNVELSLGRAGASIDNARSAAASLADEHVTRAIASAENAVATSTHQLDYPWIGVGSGEIETTDLDVLTRHRFAVEDIARALTPES